MERTVGSESVDDLLAQFPDASIDEVTEDDVSDSDVDTTSEGGDGYDDADQDLEQGDVTPVVKKLKLTPQSEVAIPDKKARLNERVSQLRKKLDEARDASDATAQSGLLDEIGNTISLIEAEDRLSAVEVAFGKAFGQDYKPSEVFRSSEWTDFGKQRKYGQDRAALYAQAVGSNDSDAIAEIFADFMEYVGNVPTKPDKKPPVTPRSNVASGAAAKPVVKRSLDSIIAKYDDAVAKLLVGNIDRKEFDKVEADYYKALKTA